MSDTRRAQRYDRLADIIPFFDWLFFIPAGLRKHAVDRLSLKPGDCVLDVGCGTGRNFPFLREAIGPSGRIYGVDLSAGMLRKARKRDRHHWTNIHLTEGDAANYLAPEPLDGVLFSLSYNTMPASSDRVAPDLETASLGRPPRHHGFQASARPWRKTTSAFQCVDDAAYVAGQSLYPTLGAPRQIGR
jgi:demethylmenaquinone methyltransferase/2-methoxy-6-polyprenyl-1,4-benzoquinol methylase